MRISLVKTLPEHCLGITRELFFRVERCSYVLAPDFFISASLVKITTFQTLVPAVADRLSNEIGALHITLYGKV